MNINYGKIKKDGFHPQGYAYDDDLIYISAYYNHKRRIRIGKRIILRIKSSKRFHSRIYYYSRRSNELVGMVILPTFAHVGGLAIDTKNNILFITDKLGKIESYNLNKLNEYVRKYNVINLSTENVEKGKMLSKENVIIKNNINISKIIGYPINASTITIFDNKLYAATFGDRGNLVEYEYQKTQEIEAKGELITRNLPGAIQGITFYNDKEDTYLITSQSYGGRRKMYGTKSCLKKYLFTDNKLIFQGQKIMDYYYCEGICCNKKGDITSIHEKKSGSTNEIIHTSFKELKNPWNDELENSYEKAITIFRL